MRYFLAVCLLVFSACSIKNYEHTKTKIIIIKSPKIRFSDVGYIRNSDKSIELELFVAGKAIEKITINHLICTNDGCMSKKRFNEEYLNTSYPDEILQNILLGHKIYNGSSLTKSKDGFSQHIKTQYVDIFYVVGMHTIYFKDKKNKIIFKFKDTDGQ
jgi:hypothetical protein